MHLNPETQKLITDFLVAVFSGAVAGLVAGWVLMRMQIRTTLALDDAPRIMNMIQALNEARNNLQTEISWQEAMRTQPDFDDEDARQSIQLKVFAANEVLLKLRVQAEDIRSNRYAEVRTYLILRVERSFVWAANDPGEVIATIKEFVTDLRGYLRRSRGPFRLKKLWAIARSYFKNRLTKEQKEILRAAIERDVSFSIVRPEEPGHAFVLALMKGLYQFDQGKPEKYISALQDLIAQGLMKDDGTDDFSLTGSGWKTGISLSSAEFDSAEE